VLLAWGPVAFRGETIIEGRWHTGAVHRTVSLLTDLGHESEQVGVLHAILRDQCPEAVVIDITHSIAPFDVRGASLALARAVPYLPEGVIVVGVDPGVGGDRRLVGVEVGDGAGVFIGPDNGVLGTGVAIAGGAGRAVVFDRPEFHLDAPGFTFAARDVLVPVAAALCNGVDLGELGSVVDPAALLPSVIPVPREENGSLACEVLWVDRFGNCQLNVSVDDLRAAWGAVERVRVRIGETTRNLALHDAFAGIGAGAAGLVTDSSGLLAVAVERGSAARELGISEGDQVLLAPGGGEPAVSVPVSIRH